MIFRKLVIIIVLIIAVIIGGVIGYSIIESLPIIDALYMTIITISTVGFGEVADLSEAGRIFTILLIIGGIAIITTGVSLIFSSIMEGTFGEILRRQRMEKKLAKMKNHFIICGCGAVGHDVIREFLHVEQKFVLIDKKEEVLNKVLEECPDIVYLVGDATEDDILRKAGIERAKGIVATLGNDSHNLYICLSARALNKNLRIIARVIEIESKSKLLKAGADYVFSPEKIGGIQLAAAALRPTVTSFLDSILKGEYLNLRLDEVMVHPNASLVGKTLKESNISQDIGIIIPAIKSSHTDKLVFNPGPDTPIRASDVLIVFGSQEQVTKLKKICR